MLDANDIAVITQIVQQAQAAHDPTNFANRNFGPNFDAYKITYGSDLEFIADTLYDTQTYAGAGQTTLTYFQTAAGRTIDLTNMTLNGMIPDRQGFLVMSIRCHVIASPFSSARAAAATSQPGVINDMQVSVLGKGTVQFNFLNKNYGTFPLWLLPAGGGVSPFLALEGATADPGGQVDFANNGYPDARNIYVLEQPLFLPPMTKLGVVANWPSALAILQNMLVKILFDGLMVRPIQ
jgi:hypothetical protein